MLVDTVTNDSALYREFDEASVTYKRDGIRLRKVNFADL